MADSIPVPEHVLRLAGLLPEEDQQGSPPPAHADTQFRQPEVVSQVFGVPYAKGDITAIPVAQHVSITAFGSSISLSRPVAVIEVSGKKVRVKGIVNPTAIILPALLVGAWNVYWIGRTVREWRRQMGRQPAGNHPSATRG